LHADFWKDERGHHHLLANDWTPGLHAYSRDGVNWTVSNDKPYVFQVEFQDGTAKAMSVRERPQLLLSKAGQPRFLSTSVQPEDHTVNDHTYTLVMKVNDVVGGVEEEADEATW
jgi:hypothetical protein